MSNTYWNVLDSLLQVLVFCDGVWLFFEAVVDDVETKVKIGLRLAWN